MVIEKFVYYINSDLTDKKQKIHELLKNYLKFQNQDMNLDNE